MADEIIIDIRKDIPDFLKYLRKRVTSHMAKAAKAKNPEPVRMITFGFEFGQANWAALIFDTREDADVDGEWTLMGIDKAMLKRPKWPIWHKLPDDAQVYFTNLEGKKINVMSDPDNLICKVVGDALKHVLLAAKNKGEFKKLLKDKKCELIVENMEGYYGWPLYAKRGKENLV
jgi:hypothetical protein